MSMLGSEPWWKDRKAWDGRGVRDFFDESKSFYLEGNLDTAIEVLEWGKRFSLEVGSGGAVSGFEAMIKKLQHA